MDAENDILKDQFIFGVNNKEIQDSLLRDIKQTDTVDTCLTAARRVESQIAQENYLAFQPNTNMMRLNKIVIIDQKAASQAKGNFTGHRVDQIFVNIVEENTSAEIVLLLVRHVISVNAKIILQMYVGCPKTDLNQEVESRKNLMVAHAQNKITIQCKGVTCHAVTIEMLKILNLMKLNV